MTKILRSTGLEPVPVWDALVQCVIEHQGVRLESNGAASN